jgi:hypothetical protein
MVTEERRKILRARVAANRAQRRAEFDAGNARCLCSAPAVVWKQDDGVCEVCDRLERLSAQYELRRSRLLSEAAFASWAERVTLEVPTLPELPTFQVDRTDAGYTVHAHGRYFLTLDLTNVEPVS